MTIALAQPGPFGALADPRFLQRGRPVPADRRRVPRLPAGHRLRRRGRGPVPVRGDDARRRFRRAARRLRPLLAVRLRPRAGASSPRSSSASIAWNAGGIALAAVAAPAAGAQPNIVALGQLLYTRYLFIFEAAGIVLLVAMVGAIVLTRRKRSDVRPQNVSRQVRRRPQDAVVNMQPRRGAGGRAVIGLGHYPRPSARSCSCSACSASSSTART